MAMVAAAYESHRNKRPIGYPFSVSTTYGQPPQSYVAPPPQAAFAASNRRFPSTAQSLFSLVIYGLHALPYIFLIVLLCCYFFLFNPWFWPDSPSFRIISATLHHSKNNWDIDLSVVNPNEKRNISYHNVEVQVEYGHKHENEDYALRGRAYLPDFYQDNKVNKSVVVHAEVLGVSRAISSLEVLNVTWFTSVRYSAKCSPLYCQFRLRVVCNGLRLGISKATSDAIGGPCECKVYSE